MPAHNRTASKRRTSCVDAHPLGPEHQAARFATDQHPPVGLPNGRTTFPSEGNFKSLSENSHKRTWGTPVYTKMNSQ
ncbi:unnamed protein product [Prunus armeniaca]